MAERGNSASAAFSSCKATTSGLAAFSHRNRFGSRRLTLLMLKVATFMPASGLRGRGWFCWRDRGSRFRRGRRRLHLGLAALVDPGKTPAEAGQHVIADGAEMVREFVDGDPFADQRHHV